METTILRDYSCKDEELPMICMFGASNLRHDLPDFSAFSPLFNPDYVSRFDSRIADVSDLILPRSETLELKIITQRMRETFRVLIDLVNRLTGYITLARLEQTISVTDFGIKYLRKSIADHDAEGVIQALHTIIGNISKYKVELQAQGMSDENISRFTDILSSVANDKQKQVEIINNRKHIVQNNVDSFNGLFGQLNEILGVGKILYKATNRAKLKDYTFSELIKHVRRVIKQKPVEVKVKVN